MIRYPQPMPASSRGRVAAPVWYGLDLLLLLVIIGPILAPLFAGSGARLFHQVAHTIIYPLGLWICPQPAHMLALGDSPMAVCSRCYAAIGGLLLVRIALTSDPTGHGIGAGVARWWHGRRLAARVALVAGTIGLWQVDLWAERAGWWSWDHTTLILSGLPIGLAIGFLLYTTLLALTRCQASWHQG